MSGLISRFATQSLRAVEDWMATAQGNISGAVRIGYKENVLMYGQGTTDIIQDPTLSTNGKQIAEQSLATGHTYIDWDQGELSISTQDTHFAIQGEGFFLVKDYDIDNRPDFDGDVDDPFNKGLYFTRDGEFSFQIVPALSATDPVLVTREGLIVQADTGGGSGGSPGGFGNSDNRFDPVFFSEFYDPNRLDRPSIVLPFYEAPGNDAATGDAVEKNEIQFSKFGATVFDIPLQAGSIKTIVNGANGNNSAINLTVRNTGDSGSFLREGYLEASNVDVARNVSELSILGKIFNAFTQLIRVDNSNMDELLKFIR